MENDDRSDWEILDALDEELGSYELSRAIFYNHVDSFGLTDLQGARVVLELAGENDGADWHWIVELKTGWVYINGWCDYTGWDCQSRADVHRADSMDEAIALCPQTVRLEFEEMRKAEICKRKNTVEGWD